MSKFRLNQETLLILLIVAAQSNTQMCIDSPVFFTAPAGYKLCLRLYPNGDGNAVGAHMSLYLVLMRGEYDAILNFPFIYQVIFCLLDQSSKQRHIVKAFNPNSSSPSFQRPRSDMNVASGITKFVSLKLLAQADNSYIQNDRIIIKAIIDFQNISSAIFHYAMCLSPSFPAAIQQTMVEEEIRKRNLQVITSASLANSETTDRMDSDCEGTLQLEKISK